MSEIGTNYQKITNLLRTPLDPPSRGIKDKRAWFEARAREMVYFLSGWAYLGIADSLKIEENSLHRVFTIPGPQIHSRKRLMDIAIDARVEAVNTLVETECAQELNMLGLTGLGLLKTTCSDTFSSAARRLTTLMILGLYNIKGLEIYLQHPEIFDGNRYINEDLRERNFNLLGWKQLEAINNRIGSFK